MTCEHVTVVYKSEHTSPAKALGHGNAVEGAWWRVGKEKRARMYVLYWTNSVGIDWVCTA